MPQYDDTIARLARLEAQHSALADSINRHDDHLGSIEARMDKSRVEFGESIKELSDHIGELKTRVFGSMLAVGVIVALLNLIGTAVGIWAALR